MLGILLFIFFISFIIGAMTGSMLTTRPYFNVTKIKEEAFKRGVDSSFHLAKKHYDSLYHTRIHGVITTRTERGIYSITSTIFIH